MQFLPVTQIKYYSDYLCVNSKTKSLAISLLVLYCLRQERVVWMGHHKFKVNVIENLTFARTSNFLKANPPTPHPPPPPVLS